MRAARSMSNRPTSVCSRASSSSGRHPRAESPRRRPRSSPPGTVVRQVRHAQREFVAVGLGRSELLLGRLQLLLDVLQLRELLGGRLALELRLAAQRVDPGDEGTPALVRLEQRVERLGRALAGERSPVGVGVVAGGLQVDHGAGESRYASITCGTALVLGSGQLRSRAPSGLVPFSTRSRSPPTRAARRSFSPSPKATVSSAREAELLGDEGKTRALGDGGIAKLEEVGERRREEEAAADGRTSSVAARRAPRARRPQRASSAAARATEQVTDLGDREVLEVRISARVRRDLGDEELVVDVAVEPEAPA